LPPYYVPKNSNDSTLVFESRFESGNLQRAVRTGDFCYDLFLCTDYNTNSHTQWFYFQVGNTRAGVSYRFNIVNLVKPRSLYSGGLQPLMYSSMKEQRQHVGWHRCGKNISYRMNPTTIERRDVRGGRRRGGATHWRTSCAFSLTCCSQFPFDDDVCYIAHCFPYTYTGRSRRVKEGDERCSGRNVAYMLSGNKCHVLTITNMYEYGEQEKQEGGREGGIDLHASQARVHPGETNSSWMMDGILRFLTGDSELADRLRNRFVFKIVPMLNPDGVVLGNYRTGLAGHDLNRRYVEASRLIHPTIHHLQRMVKRFKREREIALYLDLHGHSCKNNVFVYGCEAKGWRDWRIGQVNQSITVMFVLVDCKFKIRKNKNATGRAFMWRDFGIANTFTLEVSFAGPRRG
ncbi:hypothetical protein GUITHDRAFT_47335, partial [Guillardia theta CCMP2712]